jgi:hypothetical protein
MNAITLGIYLTIPFLIVMATMHGFTIYPVSAQTTKTSSNMTSAMMASASLHLKLADQAIKNGNTKEAFNQLNLAQLQLSMSEMRAAGTLNETQAMDFMKGGTRGGGGAAAANMKVVSDFCIIDNDGKLQCRFPR